MHSVVFICLAKLVESKVVYKLVKIRLYKLFLFIYRYIILFMFFCFQDVIRLSFFSQPDGPLMGNGSFKSSMLFPGYVSRFLVPILLCFKCLVMWCWLFLIGRIKEGLYLGPPPKEKLPKVHCSPLLLVDLLYIAIDST